MSLALIHGSCLDESADCVVNAANSGLWAGGGICGAIFARAGMNELTAACSQFKTPLEDDSAVLTPAFRLTGFKGIIHAVGPDFNDTPSAFRELFDAYYNSLLVLKENGYASISFPLISAGIFGGDLPDAPGESAKQCARAYKKFISDYPAYPVDVKLCAFTSAEYASAKKAFAVLGF